MFRLTAESTARIIRAMEDKTGEWMVDRESGSIVPADSPGALVALPPWTATDGFRLMARFVQALEGHPAASPLAAALTAGKGVYRRFKDALGAHPGLERRWHSFHDRSMAQSVKAWYEALKGALPPGVSEEDEVLEDIDAALLDFSVRAISLERALSLMDGFPSLCPLADPALPPVMAALLREDVVFQARQAAASGSAVFLEAVLPAQAEESTAGFLIARLLGLPGGRRGLVIAYCAVAQDMEDCGVEELLREEARARTGVQAILSLRRSSGKTTDDGSWLVGSLLLPPLP